MFMDFSNPQANLWVGQQFHGDSGGGEDFPVTESDDEFANRRGANWRGRYRGLWVLVPFVLLLAGCTTITEIREIECAYIEFFPHGTTSERADSAVYRDCDPPSWDGLVVRFR